MDHTRDPKGSTLDTIRGRLLEKGIDCAPPDLPEVARHLGVLEDMVRELSSDLSGSST